MLRFACGWVLTLSGLMGCMSAAPPRQPQLRLADAAPAQASEPASARTCEGDTPCEDGTPSPLPAPPDPGAPTLEAIEDTEEPIEDELETPAQEETAESKTVVHPWAQLSDAELERKLLDDPSSAGSMSVGRTNGGMLINGVRMPEGERWTLIDPAHAWGTQETIDALTTCIDAVHRQYPDSPKMEIGHISARGGGHLSPHRSHQAGRDVDVSYYYTKSTRWFTRANAGNLDRARTWAFVRALIAETDVEMILIDSGLQRLLREYALEIGEDAAWVDDIFRGVRGKHPAMIRHARGHATHIHVRFYSPIAQETARRAHALLVKHGKVKPPLTYVMHRARKGDTLGRLANKYGTTVEAIQRANGLRNTVIRAKRTYRIPQKGSVRPASGRPIVVPPRRLPPHAPTNLSTQAASTAPAPPETK